MKGVFVLAKLNDKTDKTKGVIHLMVTSLCDRNCPHCCNKQYDLNDIPYVTDEELKEAHTVFITGGEPFIYSNPPQIARRLKNKYRNINKVYIYTNAYELEKWIGIYDVNGIIELRNFIDGLNISIKNELDRYSICRLLNNDSFMFCIDNSLGRNRIYDFVGVDNTELVKHFNYFKREWQEDFKAADDSIFRKV